MPPQTRRSWPCAAGSPSHPEGSLDRIPSRPVIGLCLTQTRAQYGVWDIDTVLLPRDYVRSVQRAGGMALLLAPDPVDTADPDGLLDRLDALILAGGVDVGDDPERDAFEEALTRRALERDLPLLGICRGMQVMNVAAGGTLIQDLPGHREIPGGFQAHDVRLQPDSLAARAATGATRINSHHHQAVDTVADRFTVTGWSPGDDLPEAMEDPSRRFALGVQWHPEADPTSTVIAALVESVK